jgi:hypothetical protein
VRIGNAAYQQLQLDVFGEIADAMLQNVKAGMGGFVLFLSQADSIKAELHRDQYPQAVIVGELTQERRATPLSLRDRRAGQFSQSRSRRSPWHRSP